MHEYKFMNKQLIIAEVYAIERKFIWINVAHLMAEW